MNFFKHYFNSILCCVGRGCCIDINLSVFSNIWFVICDASNCPRLSLDKSVRSRSENDHEIDENLDKGYGTQCRHSLTSAGEPRQAHQGPSRAKTTPVAVLQCCSTATDTRSTENIKSTDAEMVGLVGSLMHQCRRMTSLCRGHQVKQ